MNSVTKDLETMLTAIENGNHSTEFVSFPDAPSKVVRDAREGLVPHAAVIDKARAEIPANRLLSLKGQDVERAKVGGEVETRAVAWTDAHVPPLLKRVQDQTSQLRAKAGTPTPSDPVARLSLQIRQQEIREAFRGVDPLHVQAVFAELPLEVRLALEAAPPVVRVIDGRVTLLPMVPPEMIAARIEADAEAADPALSQEITEIRELAALYQMLGDVVIRAAREMASRSGVVDDEITKRARGARP